MMILITFSFYETFLVVGTYYANIVLFLCTRLAIRHTPRDQCFRRVPQV